MDQRLTQERRGLIDELSMELFVIRHGLPDPGNTLEPNVSPIVADGALSKLVTKIVDLRPDSLDVDQAWGIEARRPFRERRNPSRCRFSSGVPSAQKRARLGGRRSPSPRRRRPSQRRRRYSALVNPQIFAAAVGVFFGYYLARKAHQPQPDRG